MIEEQTKKCTECLSDIPKKARMCAKCGRKQKGQSGGKHLVLGLILLFIFMGIIVSQNMDSSMPASQLNRSDGYKLAFIDSADVQYAVANEGKYNQLIGAIGQNCILDPGQKVADLLVFTQKYIREDTGKEFKLFAIGTVANERLSLGGSKVRCDKFMAAITTIISSSL